MLCPFKHFIATEADSATNAATTNAVTPMQLQPMQLQLWGALGVG